MALLKYTLSAILRTYHIQACATDEETSPGIAYVLRPSTDIQVKLIKRLSKEMQIEAS